jgi:hypothetical protein
MKNIYKSWKTTLLGIVLICSGIIYIFVNLSPDYILMSILIGVGIGLLFSPDSVIKFLKDKSKGI